jgi:hypothetical protein
MSVLSPGAEMKNKTLLLSVNEIAKRGSLVVLLKLVAL